MSKKKYNLNTIYISERLQENLKPISQSAFTAVTAPMGYGKTTAVNWYLARQSKADGAVQTVVETVAGRDSFSSDIRRNSDTRKKLSGKVATTPIPKRKKSRKEVFSYYLKNTSKYSYVPERVKLDREMLVVGRDLESDVVIPAAQVSWQHARLETGEDGIYLTDLSSVNGVFLNRKRLIKEHPVLCRVGDIVSFADITYLLCTG